MVQGQIDLDYPDEIGIILHKPIAKDCFYYQGNFDIALDHWQDTHIKAGDRIAQITLVEHKSYLFNIESEEERVGGYGSTNKEDTHISSMLDDEIEEYNLGNGVVHN